MTAALVVVQTVALVVVVGGFLRHLAARDLRELQERRELLTRIQHPSLVPVAEPAGRPTRRRSDTETDESHLVGVAQPGSDR